MEIILAGIKTNYQVITLVSGAISVTLLLFFIVNIWQTRKVLKKYNYLMQGMEGKDLEEMLTTHLKSVNKMFSRTLEIESEFKATKMMAGKSLQKVGVVRFNAFNDTGSDLSFSIALLDYHNDGLVISSLYGRNETRTYTKPIKQSTSSYHLSEEEKEAIKQALE